MKVLPRYHEPATGPAGTCCLPFGTGLAIRKHASVETGSGDGWDSSVLCPVPLQKRALGGIPGDDRLGVTYADFRARDDSKIGDVVDSALTNRSRQKSLLRSWRFWLLAICLLLLSVGGAGWYVVKAQIRADIESQLAGLDLGEVGIESIGFSLSGIAARGVHFSNDSGDEQPWLSIDELGIDHPLPSLIGGARRYDQIRLVGVEVIVDVDEFREDSIAAEFDVSQVELPSDTIVVSGSRVRLRQSSRSDLVASDIVATISHSNRLRNGSIAIVARVGDLAGSTWIGKGEIVQRDGRVEFAIGTSTQSLTTTTWSDWPLVPDDLDQSVQLDGSMALDLRITYDSSKWQFEGTSEIDSLALNLPTFDLPLQITEGRIAFFPDRVEYENVLAVTRDGGQLTGKGRTRVDSWPIVTAFSGDANEVSIDTLRQLVAAIPDSLQGKATGPVSGDVRVESDLRTTVSIDANVQSPSVRYGRIEGDATSTQVVINKLTFDNRLWFESVDGSVNVESRFADKPFDDLFTTFELNSLQKQLAITGNGTGRFTLRLPLNTVEELETWELSVVASADSATIADQAVRNVSANVTLHEGTLALAPIQATSVPAAGTNSSDGDLRVDVHWPLTDAADEAETGTISVATRATDAGWVFRAIETLVDNAMDGEDVANQAMADALRGQINSQLHLRLPALQPENIDGWTGKATIRDSTVQLEDQPLEGMTAEIELAESQLEVTNMQATSESGDAVYGRAKIRLDDPGVFELNLGALSLDAIWLREVATDVLASYVSEPDDEGGLSGAVQQLNKIRGQLRVELNVRTLPVETGEADPGQEANLVPALLIDLQASSNEMAFADIPVTNLNVHLTSQGQKIELNHLVIATGPDATLTARGGWERTNDTGAFTAEWQHLPLRTLLTLQSAWTTTASDAIGRKPLDIGDRTFDESISEEPWWEGATSGSLRIWRDEAQEVTTSYTLPHLAGDVHLQHLRGGNLQFREMQFEVTTEGDQIRFGNLVTQEGQSPIGLAATVGNKAPYPFEIKGDLDQLPLSGLVSRESVLNDRSALELTGSISGPVEISGSIAPWDWRTRGQVTIERPSINLVSTNDALIEWEHFGNDWANSKLRVDLFGGTMELVELTQQPQRIQVTLSQLNVEPLATLFGLPIEFTGQLDGDASLHDWSLASTRWAELNLRGSSVLIGPKEFGDITAHAEYRDDQVDYRIGGLFLGGKLTGTGATEVDLARLGDVEFPLDVELANGTLEAFYSGSNYFRSLRPLRGGLSASANFRFPVNATPTGTGRVVIRDASWNQRRLTRLASLRFLVDDRRLLLDDVKMDLDRGEVQATVDLPLSRNALGQFRVETRHLDLEKLSEVIGIEDWELAGFLDSRVDGQIGRRITGRGYVGFDRASLHGVSGQSARVPVQFDIAPLENRGRIELRRSRFRLFGGTVAGAAVAEFGNRFDLQTDLQLTNVHSGNLIASLADYDGLDQGRLTGRLKLSGRDIRSARDLDGSFVGSLDRASAFQLPVLEQVGRFLSTGTLTDQSFDSNEIRLALNRGQVKIANLNFQNALAKVAVEGSVYLDGRLDLLVAARVERLDQPTLIDELLGSPLARLGGSPATVLARAAEFLSDRVAFLAVRGTVNRPQIRVDAGRQIREETIRYFLSESGLFPPLRGNRDR